MRSSVQTSLSSLSLYQRELDLVHKLSRDQEKLLAPLARRGDRAARQELITAHLPLVILLVSRFLRQYNITLRESELLDLVQEGNLGLIHAVEGFDEEKGYTFGTYSSWWIKKYVLQALVSPLIRIPLYLQDLGNQLERLLQQIDQEEDQMSEEALAERLGIPVSRVVEALRLVGASAPLSLDYPLEAGEEEPLGSLVEDVPEAGPEFQALAHQRDSSLYHLLLSLEIDERQVVCLRYGLSDGEECSHAEIARRLRKDRQTIQKLEYRAMLKLQRAASGEEMRDFLD